MLQELESCSISLDQTWAWWKSLCHTGDFRMSIGKDEQSVPFKYQPLQELNCLLFVLQSFI